MKNKQFYPNKKNVPFKGRVPRRDKVYCLWCGQDFNSWSSRDEHEEKCEELGYTRQPRAREL